MCVGGGGGGGGYGGVSKINMVFNVHSNHKAYYGQGVFANLAGSRRTFLREPSWMYSSELYSGSKKLRSACSGNIRPIRRSLPLIG